jgi:hypothetical protein
LRPAITIDPVLYSPEYHFHENRLRTNPATEDPTIGYGKKGNEYDPYYHGDHKKVKILRPERESEDVKPAFQYIEQQELVTTDLDKRGRK